MSGGRQSNNQGAAPSELDKVVDEIYETENTFITNIIKMKDPVNIVANMKKKSGSDELYTDITRMIEQAEAIKNKYPNGMNDVISRPNASGEYIVNQQKLNDYLSMVRQLFDISEPFNSDPSKDAAFTKDLRTALNNKAITKNQELACANKLATPMQRMSKYTLLFKNALENSNTSQQQTFSEALNSATSILSDQKSNTQLEPPTPSEIRDSLSQIKLMINKLPRLSQYRKELAGMISEAEDAYRKNELDDVSSIHLAQIDSRSKATAKKSNVSARAANALNQIADSCYKLSKGIDARLAISNEAESNALDFIKDKQASREGNNESPSDQENSDTQSSLSDTTTDNDMDEGFSSGDEFYNDDEFDTDEDYDVDKLTNVLRDYESRPSEDSSDNDDANQRTDFTSEYDDELDELFENDIDAETDNDMDEGFSADEFDANEDYDVDKLANVLRDYESRHPEDSSDNDDANQRTDFTSEYDDELDELFKNDIDADNGVTGEQKTDAIQAFKNDQEKAKGRMLKDAINAKSATEKSAAQEQREANRSERLNQIQDRKKDAKMNISIPIPPAPPPPPPAVVSQVVIEAAKPTNKMSRTPSHLHPNSFTPIKKFLTDKGWSVPDHANNNSKTAPVVVSKGDQSFTINVNRMTTDSTNPETFKAMLETFKEAHKGDGKLPQIQTDSQEAAALWKKAYADVYGKDAPEAKITVTTPTAVNDHTFSKQHENTEQEAANSTRHKP